MASGWNLGLIEQAFADAAVDPSRWDAAIATAAEVTGSFGAMLIPFRGALPKLPHSSSMAASVQAYINDGWIHRDERRRCVPTLLRSGVAIDFDFITADEIARTPFYQELLAPYGLRWFAGVLAASEDEQWCLSIQRSIEQGPFQPGELKQLAKLSSRLGSAAALARALGFSAAATVLETYELSGMAIAMLNRHGEVIRLNRKAENLLGSGIRISKKRLVADLQAATDALDRALNKLLWSNDSSSLLPPVILSRVGRLPLMAYPIRPSSMAANVFAECQALLVLSDPEKRERPPEAALQTIFGLTAAEARLASQLATGKSVDAIADMLGIAKNTARNQLRAIFDKTGTHRQAELATLIASLIEPFI